MGTESVTRHIFKIRHLSLEIPSGQKRKLPSPTPTFSAPGSGSALPPVRGGEQNGRLETPYENRFVSLGSSFIPSKFFWLL